MNSTIGTPSYSRWKVSPSTSTKRSKYWGYTPKLELLSSRSFALLLHHVSCSTLTDPSRFWLPHFLEHTYIALRFIPQRDFERRAPLRITPKPDIINRVFMVFKGVSSETVSEWSASRLRGEKDVSWWTDEVGVELEKALDPSLYRVLEWGGMEGV